MGIPTITKSRSSGISFLPCESTVYVPEMPTPSCQVPTGSSGTLAGVETFLLGFSTEDHLITKPIIGSSGTLFPLPP